MKNKKILTEEITRIKKMMGIKEDISPIEFGPKPKFIQFLESFFGKDIEALSKEEMIERFKNSGTKLSENAMLFGNALEDVISKLKKGVLGEAEKSFVSSVIRMINPNGVTKMAESIVDSIKKSQPNTADEVINMLLDPRYPNEELIPFLQKQFPQMDDISLTLLREELQKTEINVNPKFDIKPEPPKPEPIKPEPPNPKPTPNTKDGGLGNMLIEFFKVQDFVDFLKYKWDTNKWINKSFTTGQEKGFSAQMEKLNNEIVAIAEEYNKALNSGVTTDYSKFRREIFQKLTVFRNMSQQIKRNCFENLLKALGEENKKVVERLNIREATNSYSEKKLNELWDYITEKNGVASKFETKYTTYAQGWIKLFTEKDKRGYRILNLLVNWDARLNREFNNNVLALKYGRASVIGRELFKRALIMAGFAGAIDYFLAMKENVKGSPVNIFGREFEPLVKWSNEASGDFGVWEGYKYLGTHILSASFERFKSNPIEGVAAQGPLIALFNRAMSDANLQRKRNQYETQAFEIQKNEFLNNLHLTDPNYKNLTDSTQKAKYDQDSIEAFKLQYDNMMQDWEQLKEQEIKK